MLSKLLVAAGLLGGLSAIGYFIEKAWSGTRLARMHRSRPSPGILSKLSRARPWWGDLQLIRYLVNDQYVAGPQMGQFGRETLRAEDSVYDGTSEESQAKPHLWHTGIVADALARFSWPSARRATRITDRGITELLHNGWIYVGLGARTHGFPGRGAGPSRIISYRHTIKAGVILLTTGGYSDVVRGLLAQILESGGKMQTSTGGWRQCATEFVNEDLYSSAYAVRLLHSITEDWPPWLDVAATDLVENAISQSIEWLGREWYRDRWQYGDVRPQENAGIILAEIAPALIYRAPELAADVANFIDSNLTALGHPGPGLLDGKNVVGPASTAIRLAYALFRYEPQYYTTKISELLNYAMTHPAPGAVDSADMAMTLAMRRGARSSSYSQEVKR